MYHLFRILPIALLVVMGAHRGLAADVFVDHVATGANDGTSWSNAFTRLQDALTQAVSGDTLWIAAGIYFPDEGQGKIDNSRFERFVVDKKINVVGGFESGDTQLADSDPGTNLTVLSGDIEQDDVDPDGDGLPAVLNNVLGTNSERVLELSGITEDQRISGFYVVGGVGTSGAGIHVSDSECSLEGIRVLLCQVTGNGGALLVEDCQLTLRDCFISSSRALLGGGMYFENSSVTIQGTRIEMHEALNRGGGIYATDSSVNLSSSTLGFSQSSSDGGGIYFTTSGNDVLSIRGSRLEGNISVGGSGAGASVHGGQLDLTNTYVRGNSCNGSGGTGGGLDYADASVYLKNVLVSGNRAGTSGSGGGISSRGASMTEMQNCTVVNNLARTGGAVSGGNVNLVNSIIWGNRSTLFGAAEIGVSGSNTFSHSIVEGVDLSGSNQNVDGTAGINDPQFLDPTAASPPTRLGDYQLAAFSTLVDRGDNASYSGPATDLNSLPGQSRFFDSDLDSFPEIDLGPFETHQNNIQDTDSDGLPDSYEAANTVPASFTSLDPFSDPDSDGAPTLLEFATGHDPNDAIQTPEFDISANTGRAVLSYSSNLLAENFVDLTLESSTDLGSADAWAAASVTTNRFSNGAPPGSERVVSTATLPITVEPARQYRLRVSKK